MPGGLGMAACTKALPVRGRGAAIAPVRTEGVCMLGIDQLGQGGTVGFIPDMGSLLAIQLGVGDAGA